VDRNLVLGKGVDTLHDIDFTSIRPVVTVHPPGGPCSTSSRGVNSIHDNHTTSVSLLSVDSHSFSATGNVFGLVDSHDGVTLAVDRDQSLVPSITGTLVRDGTMGRVVVCPKVEMVKEIVSLPRLFKRP